MLKNSLNSSRKLDKKGKNQDNYDNVVTLVQFIKKPKVYN